MIVKMFKAQKQTHRFRANQKVWVRYDYGNHMEIWFKWRGSGRYTRGIICKYTSKSVGPRVEIDVTESFAHAVRGPRD